MFKQREAIIRLLSDEDPETVQLTKQQLAQGGSASIPDLRELLNLDDARVTDHVREILAEIEAKESRERLTARCQNLHSIQDLEEACWLLARVFLPGTEVTSSMALVDSWGKDLQQRLEGVRGESDQVRILEQLIARELGFRGNVDDYYNVRNSLLPCLIESRLGIPISLSVLYMILAERAGLSVVGINLPGHFVVRLGTTLFDPFHEGKVLTMRDCAAILAHQKLALEPSHLQAAAPKLIFLRMLANLLHIFEGEQTELSQLVAHWIGLIDNR